MRLPSAMGEGEREMNLLESKCKCCGAPMESAGAENEVITCKYCGSVFTVPKAETVPEALDLIRIGNHKLDVCRFSDAYAAFERAAKIDPEESESYMGMALAEFRVQYIRHTEKEEGTGKEKLRLQPICHEMSEKVFSENANYKAAVEKASGARRAEYIRQGKEIDYIRKEFRKLESAGLVYDCFICVKVSDDEKVTADGRKLYTADAKTAENIYRYLREKGYKPFFSEREVGDRTGADYEALILYALQSSECMLVVCGKESYLQTPWVKNEYGRFTELIGDEEKESDSIAIVFDGKPIERLPDRKGKLQGIDMRGVDPYGKIERFVEQHTPQAREKRARESERKLAEEKERQKKLDEQERALAEQRELIARQQEMLENILRNQDKEKEEKAEEKSGSEGAQTQKKGWGGIADKVRGAAQSVAKEVTAEVGAALGSVRGKVAGALGIKAFDFEIADGVLKKYKGKGGAVTIPAGVHTIGAESFENCKELTGVAIGKDVKSIGEFAFAFCENLTDVQMGDGVLRIGKRAFSECKNLKNLTLSRSLQYVGMAAFSGCKIESVTLPANLTHVDSHAFSGCLKLANVAMPRSVAKIGAGAFSHCRALREVTVPERVTCIEENAFGYCDALAVVRLPSGITEIRKNAFAECENLTAVSLPESVTKIGECAFLHCRSLKKITLPRMLTSIGLGAFGMCESLTEIVIPDGVTELADETFRGCGKLTRVALADGLTHIGEKVFYECESLAEIKIPNGVVHVGDEAFEYCPRLARVTLPKRLEGKAELFGEHAEITWITFETEGDKLNRYCGADERVEIPASVARIGERAFADCDLREVFVPASVTRIEKFAFFGCKNLKRVTMPKKCKKFVRKAFEKARRKEMEFVFLP